MTEQSAADRAAYGGQAVIEGVMIRGKTRVATACRLPDGTITLRRDAVAGSSHRFWMRIPFVRGMPALWDSLKLGYGTLMWSADQALEGEQQEKLSPLQTFLTMAFAFGMALVLFKLIPAWLTGVIPGIKHQAATPDILWWQQLLPSWQAFLPNLVETGIVALILVGYILFVLRRPEVKRIFAYHGAEHKVVNGYEAGADLSVDAVRGYSRIHPRCGTSFIFLTIVVSFLVHLVIGWPENVWLRMGSRLALLPIVVGIAYELIRLSGRYRNSKLLMALVSPGLLLQRLTTAEPEDDQIEVALASMRAVLEDEGVLPAPTPAVDATPAEEPA